MDIKKHRHRKLRNKINKLPLKKTFWIRFLWGLGSFVLLFTMFMPSGFYIAGFIGMFVGILAYVEGWKSLIYE